jgi:hypothetical protein
MHFTIEPLIDNVGYGGFPHVAKRYSVNNEKMTQWRSAIAHQGNPERG